MMESLGVESAEAEGGTHTSAMPGGPVAQGLALRRWSRVVGHVTAPEPGPTLFVVGGLHGNEPAGLMGLERVFARIGEVGLARGEFIGVAGNLEALAVGRRFVDEDLNRIWLRPRLEALRTNEPVSVEERELRELDEQLRATLARARGEVYGLDLHTISGPGPAFVVIDDTLLNRRYANRFPVPLVLGLDEELSGTMAHHLTAEGVIPVGFEAGQHEESAAAERAEAAIWIALEAAGLLADGQAEFTAARRRLLNESRGLPFFVEVRHRHAIIPGDGFRSRPGLISFQPVESGEPLADDHSGEIRAPLDGMVLMPLYQEQGEDGFFLVRPVKAFWLRLSERVRPWRLERFLHWLPGVHRHPDHDGAFIIDRRIARWEALQIFHLLGFRRRWTADRYLVMARRRQGRD
ncbi:MAG: succinylglutamate desuccinylase/aspartoacylase family protein [Thermoanaerobaculia bacterium]